MWGVNILSSWISCICIERSVISFEELNLEVSNDGDRETNCLGVRFNRGDEKQWREAKEKVGEHSDQIKFDQGLRSMWGEERGLSAWLRKGKRDAIPTYCKQPNKYNLKLTCEGDTKTPLKG